MDSPFRDQGRSRRPRVRVRFRGVGSQQWVLHPDGVLHNDLSQGDKKGTDIATKALFKDFDLHVELMIPSRSNSGVYLRGNIEIQVSDSFGKTAAPGNRDMGSIYSKKRRW